MEGMTRRIRIATEREAEIIIEKIEGLIKKGQKLSDKQKYDHEFAKMFFNDIKKRKEKGVRRMDTEEEETKPHSETGHFERRKYPRFNVDLPIQYNKIALSISHNGRIMNLSEGGMMMHSAERMEIGQHLKSKLTYILGSEIDTVEMQAEVVWRSIYLNKAWGDFRCGVKFLDVAEKDKAKLKTFLMN